MGLFKSLFAKKETPQTPADSAETLPGSDVSQKTGTWNADGVINSKRLLEEASSMNDNTPWARLQAVREELDAMESIITWFHDAITNKEYDIMGHREENENRYSYGFIEMQNGSGYDFGMFSCAIGFRYIDGSTGQATAVVHDWKDKETGELRFDWPEKDPLRMQVDVKDISYKDRKKPVLAHSGKTLDELRREARAAMQAAGHSVCDVDGIGRGGFAAPDFDDFDDLGLDSDPSDTLDDLDHGDALDDLDLDDSDDSAGEWDREATIAKAEAYMEGTSYYDHNDALTAVEAWIYSLDEEPDDGELYNQCINELDLYDNYEHYENVPSRYRDE